MRRSGRTTRQIRKAPKGALFIWPTAGNLAYPKKIAEKEGRGDLRIESRAFLNDGRHRGLRSSFPFVVMDHSCSKALTDVEFEAISDLTR